MKLNYNYDDDGVFTCTSIARKDPLETKRSGADVFLLPRNATHVIPPSCPDGYYLKWDTRTAAWEVIEIPRDDVEHEDGHDSDGGEYE